MDGSDNVAYLKAKVAELESELDAYMKTEKSGISFANSIFQMGFGVMLCDGAGQILYASDEFLAPAT